MAAAAAAKSSEPQVEVVVVGRQMTVHKSATETQTIDVILGEGCAWDAKRQVLYWIDILGKRVFEYSPTANTNRLIPVDAYVGCVVPRAATKQAGSSAGEYDLVAALQTGFHIVSVSGGDKPLARSDLKQPPQHPARAPDSSDATAASGSVSDCWKSFSTKVGVAFSMNPNPPLNVFAASVKQRLICAPPPAPPTADGKASPTGLDNPNRFNDGKCDPAGRFFAGTMQIDEDKDNLNRGALYSLTASSAAGGGAESSCSYQLSKLYEPVTISNGLAWSLDHKAVYYIDSTARCVARFDYDLKTGLISNRRVVISITEELGWPDGCCLDSEGKLWVAQWGGSCVNRWCTESGKLLQTIRFPTSKISCCCFGGADGKDLYVTSAAKNVCSESCVRVCGV